LNDVENIPVMPSEEMVGPYIRDVAKVEFGTIPGEYDHYNSQRMISITANVHGEDLGRAARAVESALNSLGAPPRSVIVRVRGQVRPMNDTFQGLAVGLSLAIAVIFLLLLGYYQSPRLAFVALSCVPAVIAGVAMILLLTGTTLNIESFMGSIMCVGVGVANAILVVTFSEQHRHEGQSARDAAIHGASSRLRPVLMTSIAMIAGMVPMALGLSEGGEESAPLGRAVIGGLAASTLAVLLILPVVFATVQKAASRKKASIHPDDSRSMEAAL